VRIEEGQMNPKTVLLDYFVLVFLALGCTSVFLNSGQSVVGLPAYFLCKQWVLDAMFLSEVVVF